MSAEKLYHEIRWNVVSAASLDAEAAQFMPQRMSPVSSRKSHTLAFI
jgi:hypothetical protein